MQKSDIIERFKSVVIQLATPYSTGTGFFLVDYNLIVTNEHVIRDNKQVVIDGLHFDKQLTDVVYVDPKYDLAFLKAPEAHEMPDIKHFATFVWCVSDDRFLARHVRAGCVLDETTPLKDLLVLLFEADFRIVVSMNEEVILCLVEE